MDEKPEDLLPFYALGALSPDERSAVEAYVAAHPEAQAQLSQMQRSAAELPFAAEQVQPSPALKKQLMQRAQADARSRLSSQQPDRSKTARGRTWGWLMPAISLASLLVALAAVIWALSLRGQIGRLEAQTATLEQELNTQRTVLTQLTSPSSQAFAIPGTQLQPAARGQFIADASTGTAVLVVSGLKELPADRTYEIWLIQGKTAVPAGLFNADTQGRAILQVPHTEGLSSYTAVGVSVEPAGGSPQPGQDIVMLGKVY